MNLVKIVKRMKWLSLKESFVLFVVTGLLIGGWELFVWNEVRVSQNKMEATAAKIKASIVQAKKKLPESRRRRKESSEFLIATYIEWRRKHEARFGVRALKPGETGPRNFELEDTFLVPTPEPEPLPVQKGVKPIVD